MQPRVAVLLGLFLTSLASVALAQKAVGRGETQAPPGSSSGNAALFVGVNEFTEDRTLRTLRYAVNDAIALAHLFVIDLKLIPAGRATLALSGQPSGESAAQQFEALRQAGVSVESATKARLLRRLQQLVGLPRQESELLIFSVSSHGFESGGTPYFMPADGMKAFLADTGLSLVSVEQALSESKAGKRIILLDACREKPVEGARAGGGALSAVFKTELGRAAGQAVLASCDVGQYSWEDERQRLGVFTRFVIEGLRGSAEPDAQGLIRIEQLMQYVSSGVESWSRSNTAYVQQPWFKGPGVAGRIPLALDSGLAARLSERLQVLRELAIDGKLTVPLWNDAQRLFDAGPTDDNARKRLQIYTRLADRQTDPDTARLALESLFRTANSSPPPPPVGTPRELVLDLGGGEKLDLVLIPAGRFQMGSPESEEGRDSDEYQHWVRISRAFYMGKYEVTQGQWRAVMGSNPSLFEDCGDDCPVEQVSWEDASEFCRRLSARAGREIRLPSEAEWEYACRAGSTTPFHLGETISTGQANYDGNYTYGSGSKGVYRQKPVRVGSFSPNGFGLYDMHGNVREWCRDWYGADYYKSAPEVDPAGPGSGSDRVLRGGSWGYYPRYCRSASRGRRTPGYRNCLIGFRISSGTP